MSLRIYKDVKIEADVNAVATPAALGTASEGATPVVSKEDVPSWETYRENIIKLIPGEVIVSYPTFLFLFGQLPIPDLKETLAGIVSIGLTAFLRLRAIPQQSRPLEGSVLVSLIACVLWIYQQKGFIFIRVPDEWHPAVLAALVLFTIIAPHLSPKEERQINSS